MKTSFAFLLAIVLLHFSSCVTTYNKSGKANLHPNYKTTIVDSVAVVYFTHHQTNISSMATFEAESVLKQCRNISFLTASETEELLQKAGVFVFPQHTTIILMDSLRKVIPYRYLLRGIVNQWDNPIFGDNPQGPKVNISLELWDLRNSKIVWTFNGGEQSTAFGGEGVIISRAHKAQTQMNHLLKRAFKTWGGLCDFPKEIDE